eukprot:m51a1_g13881 hypothetical protein (479) ;mRNA; f:651634-653070
MERALACDPLALAGSVYEHPDGFACAELPGPDGPALLQVDRVAEHLPRYALSLLASAPSAQLSAAALAQTARCMDLVHALASRAALPNEHVQNALVPPRYFESLCDVCCVALPASLHACSRGRDGGGDDDAGGCARSCFAVLRLFLEFELEPEARQQALSLDPVSFVAPLESNEHALATLCACAALCASLAARGGSRAAAAALPDASAFLALASRGCPGALAEALLRSPSFASGSFLRGCADAVEALGSDAATRAALLRGLHELLEAEEPRCVLDVCAEHPRTSSEVRRIIAACVALGAGPTGLELAQQQQQQASAQAWEPADDTVEALRLLEVLGNDSNFKSDTSAAVAAPIVRFLSAVERCGIAADLAPAAAKKGRSPRVEAALIVLRLVSSLHCFNDRLCKPSDRGKFASTAAAAALASGSAEAAVSGARALYSAVLPSRRELKIDTGDITLFEEFVTQLSRRVSNPSRTPTPPP